VCLLHHVTKRDICLRAMQQNRVAPDKHQLRNIACPSTHISHAQDTHNTSPQFSPVPYTTCHVLCMHLKRYQIPSNHYIFLPSERSVCMQSTALSLRLLSSFWYSVEPLWLGLFCLPVKEFYGTQYQSGLLFLNFMWGVVFTAACVVFLILFFSWLSSPPHHSNSKFPLQSPIANSNLPVTATLQPQQV